MKTHKNARVIAEGTRFGRLIVVGGPQKSPKVYSTALFYSVRCDCGTITLARGTMLRDASKKSCGCLSPGGSQLPEIKRANTRAWRAANPEWKRRLGREYKRRNPDRDLHNVRLRQVRLWSATPKWANLDAIKKIYADAAWLRAMGHDVHVDHVVPLRGKTVCGLHVETNLQIIRAEANCRKGARHEEN